MRKAAILLSNYVIYQALQVKGRVEAAILLSNYVIGKGNILRDKYSQLQYFLVIM